MPAPFPSPPPKRLPVLLRRAWFGLNQAFRQRTAHLGITPDQFSILRWLSEGDPQGMTQRALTDLMASDANTITSTLSRMEKAGLIARQLHETDRRARRVKLQPAGRRALTRGRKIALELQEQVLTALPAARRGNFLKDLNAIATACASPPGGAAKQPGAKRAARPNALGSRCSISDMSFSAARLFLAALSLAPGSAFAAVAAVETKPDTAQTAFFEKNIRPVLAGKCYKCHSADADKVRGGLLLDTRDGLRKGGDTGPAIVPGNPGESLLIQALHSADKDTAMPPEKSGGKLPAKVIADFEAWVKMGAPDPREGAAAAPVVIK